MANEPFMVSLKDRIASSYQELSVKQRQVAQYAYDHSGEVFFLSARQLADRAGVSEASVSRFARSLGFSSYAAFREALAREALQEERTTKRLADTAAQFRKQGILAGILDRDVENIQRMRHSLPQEAFNRAVEALCSARRIYVLGLRSSYALAFYFTFNLRFVLNNVVQLQPNVEDLPEQILEAGKEDLLAAISFKRYTRRTVELTEAVRARGATVIGLTDSELSPIAQVASIRLVACAELPTFFESYTAPMSLLNAVLTAVAVNAEDRAMPALDRLETALEDLGTYY